MLPKVRVQRICLNICGNQARILQGPQICQRNVVDRSVKSRVLWIACTAESTASVRSSFNMEDGRTQCLGLLSPRRQTEALVCLCLLRRTRDRDGLASSSERLVVDVYLVRNLSGNALDSTKKRLGLRSPQDSS